MKNFFGALFIVTLVLAVGSTSGHALDLSDAKNITIWDGQERYPGERGEDNETEPTTVAKQKWDLEAFFLEDNLLTAVGGFDFKNGVTTSKQNYAIGDLFIDLDGDAEYGTNSSTKLNWGYEYAVRFVFDDDANYENGYQDIAYEVYKLDADTTYDTAGPTDVTASSPWRIDTSNDKYELMGKGGLWNDVTGSDLKSWGGDDTRYALQVNLNDIPGYADSIAVGVHKTFHLTMQCGNDDLIGDPVPEPSTVFLLGAGLLGIVAAGRKRLKK